MKKLLFLSVLLFPATALFCQHLLTGKVTDAATGLPIPQATIELRNGTSTVADDQGAFHASLKKGTQQIRISGIGYKTLEQDLSASDAATTFRLEPVKLFLQPVEIRAVRAGDNAPFTKTNLYKKDIEKANLGRDLPFLLDQTPSVVINSDAGNGVGYTGIRIRGSDATRINVTLNGIPYNDVESQGTFFVDLPDISSSINSIQIQRGVGTSSNGAGAFGASLNISTNEFREQAYGEVNNSYGSFNTWKHTVKAGSGLINNHFTIDARLSKVSSDGYIDRASSNLHSFYLSAAYLNPTSSLRLNVFSGKEKTYQAWNGILQEDLARSRTYNSAGTEKPGEPYDNQTDNYQQDHYQLFFNHHFSNELSFNTAVFLTRGLGYYEEYHAQESYSGYGLANYITGMDTIRKTDLVRQLWLDNYFYGNITSVQYKNGGTQLTGGLGINRYDGKHYGKITWSQLGGIPKDYRWYNLDAFKTDASVYGKLQQSLSANWNGFVDLQYRTVKYDLNGFRKNPQLIINNTYNFFNPKAGIAYNKGNWKAYLSYSQGNKEPNRDDFEAGVQEQPRPEKLHDIELNVEKRTALYTWSATFYYMLYKDQLVLTGKQNDVGAYTRTNVRDSYRRGIELQGTLFLNPWLNAGGNLTLSENKILNSNEFLDDYDNGGQKLVSYHKTDISFSPAVIGSAALNFLPVKRGELSLIGKYVGRQYLDNTGSKARSLGDYYVQDLRAVYTLNKLFDEISLVFQLNNVFNRKYEPNGATYSYISGGTRVNENYLFPMAGTNWMVGVNVKL
ncbi:MAG: carboxypeptidase-like regulatory domain-containing protein [Williamsia sp.]|nr:carboxypeptidase-like regulatory domain-containing protein [Williamsia sp.]